MKVALSTDNDVLIVGAGPTGLVLAIELARRGVVPRVVDAGPPDMRESRAAAVVARSLEMLDDIGLAGAAVERGLPLRRLSFHQGSTTLADLDLSALDSPFPMDLCIPQWRTVGLLRERAEELGVSVAWNTRLASRQADEGGVTAELVHGDGRVEHHTARWLVGCDGAHSTVRRTACFGWETADLHRGFVLGDVAADWGLERDRFHAFFGPGGILAVFPMAGGHWRILAGTPDDNPPGDPGLSDYAAYVGRRTPLDPRLRDLRWSSAFVVREGLADRFRRGRVLLAGDAAHSHSPIGGQGMNTGMQDAYNLGWKLALVATGRAAPLPDSFEEERRPVARAVVEATSTATRVATARNPALRRARHHALRLLGRSNPYRDSALVSDRTSTSPTGATASIPHPYGTTSARWRPDIPTARGLRRARSRGPAPAGAAETASEHTRKRFLRRGIPPRPLPLYGVLDGAVASVPRAPHIAFTEYRARKGGRSRVVHRAVRRPPHRSSTRDGPAGRQPGGAVPRPAPGGDQCCLALCTASASSSLFILERSLMPSSWASS